MISLMIAAAVAAQPAPAMASAPAQPTPMMQMGDQQGNAQQGQMAEMKGMQDCCKDMMSKMHEGHSAGHERHPNH